MEEITSKNEALPFPFLISITSTILFNGPHMIFLVASFQYLPTFYPIISHAEILIAINTSKLEAWRSNIKDG